MTVLDPVLEDVLTNNPDKVKHIINQHHPGNSIADASIFGTEVEALCGHRFIPTRDHTKFPVCPSCKAVLESMG